MNPNDYLSVQFLLISHQFGKNVFFYYYFFIFFPTKNLENNSFKILLKIYQAFTKYQTVQVFSCFFTLQPSFQKQNLIPASICMYLHENSYQTYKNKIRASGFNNLMEISLVPTCCSEKQCLISEKEQRWYSLYTSDLCFIL